MYYQLCTTSFAPPVDSLNSEGEFSTVAVDKSVEKAVRFAKNRCHG